MNRAAGSPKSASPDVVRRVSAATETFQDQRRAVARRTAEVLRL